MATLLALRGANSYADGYGVLAADLWDFATLNDWSYNLDPSDFTQARNKQIAACHLIIAAREGAAGDNILHEISYDDADLEGTFRVPGHPGVLGIWLAAYTRTGNTCTPPPPPPPVLSISEKIEAYLPDPGQYIVSEAAGDAAFMARRGMVWPPGERAHAYL